MAEIRARWPDLGVRATYAVDFDEQEGAEPSWSIESYTDDPATTEQLAVLRRDLRRFFGPDYADREFDGEYVVDVLEDKARRIAERWPGAEIEVDHEGEGSAPDGAIF